MLSVFLARVLELVRKKRSKVRGKIEKNVTPAAVSSVPLLLYCSLYIKHEAGLVIHPYVSRTLLDHTCLTRASARTYSSWSFVRQVDSSGAQRERRTTLQYVRAKGHLPRALTFVSYFVSSLSSANSYRSPCVNHNHANLRKQMQMLSSTGDKDRGVPELYCMAKLVNRAALRPSNSYSPRVFSVLDSPLPLTTNKEEWRWCDVMRCDVCTAAVPCTRCKHSANTCCVLYTPSDAAEHAIVRMEFNGM